MEKNLKLISAEFLGAGKDFVLYGCEINYYNQVVHINIEEHYHNPKKPNNFWVIIGDVNLNKNEKEEIVKTIYNDRPEYSLNAKPKIYNKLFELIYDVKSINGWNASRYDDLTEYIHIGDRVDRSVRDYFINSLPPITMTNGIIQMGGPYSTDSYGRNTYLTIAKDEYSDDWYYKGPCIKGSIESVDIRHEFIKIPDKIEKQVYILEDDEEESL